MGKHWRLIMDKFINPVVYKKESVEINGTMRTGLYFQDVNGRDWYETLCDWKGAVATDERGLVIAYESDVSFMGMQEGRDVYEVEPENVPKNVLGNYKFSDGVFVDVRPGDSEKAEQIKMQLLGDAASAIAPLEDAVDLNMATNEEKELLLKWKKYRVLLNRVDVTKAPDIDWPVKPDAD